MFSTLELQYIKALKSKHYLHLSEAMESKLRRSIISKLNRWTNAEEPVVSRILTLSDSTWKFNE
jgi:hypothetical protein